MNEAVVTPVATAAGSEKQMGLGCRNKVPTAVRNVQEVDALILK
jgi:hypothetical protein